MQRVTITIDDDLVAEIETRLAASRVTLDLVLDAADGAGVSWLHRHTEVMRKVVDEETGRIGMIVRTAPDKAKAVREKFAAPSSPLVGEGGEGGREATPER